MQCNVQTCNEKSREKASILSYFKVLGKKYELMKLHLWHIKGSVLKRKEYCNFGKSVNVIHAIYSLKYVIERYFHKKNSSKSECLTQQETYFSCKKFHHFEEGSRSGKYLKVSCVLILCNKRDLCIYLEELLALKIFMKGFTRRK